LTWLLHLRTHALQVVHFPFQHGGVYPGIFLYTQPARMVRPVRQLSTGKLELIGTLEQNNMNIRSVYMPPTEPRRRVGLSSRL
jgi:hypothetical protein